MLDNDTRILILKNRLINIVNEDYSEKSEKGFIHDKKIEEFIDIDSNSDINYIKVLLINQKVLDNNINIIFILNWIIEILKEIDRFKEERAFYRCSYCSKKYTKRTIKFTFKKFQKRKCLYCGNDLEKLFHPLRRFIKHNPEIMGLLFISFILGVISIIYTIKKQV